MSISSASNPESSTRFTIAADAGDVGGQGILAHICIEALDYDCARKWWTRIVAGNSSEHQVIVDEARNNLAFMQEDPGYIAHMLGKRLGD
jgi:hypothetical protein